MGSLHGSDGSAEVPGRKPSAEGIASKGEFDLLTVPLVRRLVFARWFPRLPQAMLLAVFIFLILAGWGVVPPAGTNARLFAKSHPVTLLVWGLWWPLMVWMAVWFGRAWCAVCPLELVSHLGERLGHHGKIPRRPLPRWIAAGTLIVVLYGAIQLLVAGLQIHRVPAYTAWFLVGLLTCALLVALIFRDRPFCRGFCPVGLLLGTYGRGGMIAVRSRSAATSGLSSLPNATVCPSLLNPSKLCSNVNCLVCCRCIKASAPGQMRLLLRRPFATTDAREFSASWPVTLFVMSVFGFVTGELTTEWPAADEVLTAVPKRVSEALNWPGGVHWLEGVWTLIVVPIVFWTLLAGGLRILGKTGSVGRLWREMALPMAVVISAGHMAKGLAKLVSWMPFAPHALREPSGDTARAIASHELSAPTAILPLWMVGILGLVLVGWGVVYGVRELRLANPFSRWITAVSVALAGVVFAAVICGWL